MLHSNLYHLQKSLNTHIYFLLYLHKFYKKKLLVGLLSVIIFFILPNFSYFKFDQKIQELDWIDLTTVELNEYIHSNSIVFVDISADWCATCQFNKINVINSSKIKEIFEKNNIIKLRGDWTKPNKQIENFLQQHNRYGIPLNVMYSSSYPEGIILSELLTIKEITNTPLGGRGTFPNGPDALAINVYRTAGSGDVAGTVTLCWSEAQA